MNSTSCVIGRTQLAIDCSKELLKVGIIIQHIFTDDADFRDWAKSLKISVNGIAYLRSEIKKGTSLELFSKLDYLFSIVNDVIVPQNILSAVRKIAINYHNGPLPNYGGSNSTHWALIFGEKTHGVVWHRMLAKVDSGEVIVRREIDIDPSDNLVSLNWKCWEAAKESFHELCHKLPYCQASNISISPTIYKKPSEKPSAFCILPFECAAQKVYNTFRGTCNLNFEGKAPITQPNEIGLPKLFLSDQNKLLVVTGMTVLREALMPKSEPGSVVSIADHLRIATCDNDVMITGLMEMNGSVVPKPFVESLRLMVGTVVNTEEAHNTHSYLWKLSQYSLAGENERKWISELNHPGMNSEYAVPVLVWPYSMHFTTNEIHSVTFANEEKPLLLCSVNNERLSAWSMLNAEIKYEPEILVLASFLCFLLLLTPSMSGSVDIKLNGVPSRAVYLQSILHFVPTSFQLSKDCNFLDILKQFGEKLSSVIYGSNESDVRKKAVASDIFLRYSLEAINNEIVVGIIEQGETFSSPSLYKKRVAIYCSKSKDVIDVKLVGSSIFSTANLENMKDNFLSFLFHALDNSKLPCFANQAILCSEKEAKFLFHDSAALNGPTCDQNLPIWFHIPFEEIAFKLPFGIAVIDEMGYYTYKELNQKAEDIANFILENAKGSQFDRIALLLDRSWLYLAAIIASLKLGVTYIPMETVSPALFNCEIIQDSKANLMLVDDSDHWMQNWQNYAKCTPSVKVITLYGVPLSMQPVTQRVGSIPHKPAVLLYTSGTTAEPKGILISHKGLCNVISCVIKRMCIQACDAEDLKTEYSLYDASPMFDTCFLQIFPILWNGGTVIITPTDPLKPNKLSKLFPHVTFLSTTPRKLFLYRAEDFKCARNVAVGGEDPSIELYKRWEKVNRSLWNLYGPAEISVITSMGIVKDQVHMGLAVDNSVLRILNPFQKAVPIGVPGELYIFGCGVAQGYTQEKITKVAFGVDSETGLRWYRSGDLVVLDHFGVLRYIGRIPSDKQVKIGGKRVEPLGIEYALKAMPGVQYAEVIVERPARNVNLLVAYVAPDSIDVNALNSKLKCSFPEHMLPSLIIPVDLGDAKLSRTGKMKLDMTKYRHKFSDRFQPPCTDLEKELLANYRELLGIADTDILGMHDSFRTFGGNSVIAVSLADRIRSLFGWNLKPLEILNCTPAELVAKQSPSSRGGMQPSAKFVDSATDQRSTDVRSSPLLNNEALGSDTELSAMQQSLLQMRITQIGASYNIPVVLEIIGSFNIFHLTTTIEAILSNIPNCKGSGASVFTLLNEVDLSNNHWYTKDRAIHMIQADICTPLDLKTSSYRCRIYYLSGTHCILSLLVHHIAFDYQSWNTLQNIAEKLYIKGCTAFVPSNNTLDWSKFVQSEHAQYELKKKEVDKFWHGCLHGYPYFIPFPTSFPRSNTCHHRGRRAMHHCDQNLYQIILSLCSALEVQPTCFFLSIFALLIYRLSQQHKFCIAVVCSRRANAEHKDTIGFVANTLVCGFTSTILTQPFQNVLHYTQSWHDNALKNGCIPFSELIKIWGYNESQPAHHLPQFILNCIPDYRNHTLNLGDGVSAIPIGVETYTSKAELLLDVFLSQSDFSCTWEYDTHIFTSEAIRYCIGREYLNLLYDKICHFGVNVGRYNSCIEDYSRLLLTAHCDTDKVESAAHENQQMSVLSSYQRAVLGSITKTPQSHWGYFNSICLFEVNSDFTKQHVQHAIERVVQCNQYLNSIVSANCDYLEVKDLCHIDICYETVMDEVVSEAIQLRELVWPFDTWAGSLFHCTLVHNKKDTKSKVLISASLILLDEQSLVLFCKLVHETLLSDTAPPSLGSPHTALPRNSVSETENEYFRQVVNTNPPLCIQPLSLMEMVQNYSVVNATWGTNFTFLDQCPAFSCAAAAVLLWSLKKSAQVQVCFLFPCALTEQHFCSNENILPLGLSVQADTCFSDIITAAHEGLKNKSIVDYWSLQNNFDPCSDYLHPHHEILVQVVNCKHKYMSRCIRPFCLHLQLCKENKTISLASILSPQHTSVVFDTFTSMMKSLQHTQSTDIIIAEMLSDVKLPLSIVQGRKISMTPDSLRDKILTVLTKNKCLVSHMCYHHGTMMAMTYEELHTQSKILSSSLQCVFGTRLPASRHVAILVKGGFELPVAVIAAILSNITFTIIDPNEQLNNIVHMLNIVKPDAIIYDADQTNLLKSLLSAKQSSNMVPILVDVFSESNCSLHIIPEQLHYNEHAYVVFTSGSTGIPKAAPILGKSFCNFLAWHKDMIPTGSPLNWLQLSSLSFDICITEMIGQLYCGNTLFLSNLERKLHIDYIFTKMHMFNIEGIHVVPTYLSYLLRHLDTSKEHFPSLKHIFSTGEKLSKQLCSSIFKIFKFAILHNWGGPSECCVEALHCTLTRQEIISEVPVGTPANNCTVQIVSPTTLKTLWKLMLGEVVISGIPVFDGYLNSQQASPFVDICGQKYYRTGDIGYMNNKDQVVFAYRMDAFKKVSGQNVDLEGIRVLIMQLSIAEVIDVIIDIIYENDIGLVCYPVVSSKNDENGIQCIIASHLPKRYVPLVVKCLYQHEVPLLRSGKTDYKALKDMANEKFENKVIPKLETCDFSQTFFHSLANIVPSCSPQNLSINADLTLNALGLSSMHKVQLFESLRKSGVHIKINTLLMDYSLRDIINIMDKTTSETRDPQCQSSQDSSTLEINGNLVAIINMQVNVPGAASCSELWKIVTDGRETISHNLSQSSGMNDDQKVFIGSRGLIKNKDMFDAELFNFPTNQAELLDPQQRMLLHMVWAALEECGYAPDKLPAGKKVGCFAGAHFPHYMLKCLQETNNDQEYIIWSNLRDNISLQLGRALNFRGPCVTIANNCTTFAVALHYARISLISNECDIAVVAASSVHPEDTGYFYTEGDVYSSDGHCRPFSQAATGTVMSDGITVAILKRLHDAEMDRDDILCLVKGSAVGADGSLSGNTRLVPSAVGQAETLEKVFQATNVDPNTIFLIEAHGTGTRTGDHVELSSLTSVFEKSPAFSENKCVLGSIKGNIGHTGVTAAGPSILKAAFALKHAELPPTRNCEDPLQELKDSKHFRILEKPIPWAKSAFHNRRALVHSVGAMGTNCAIILEEYQGPKMNKSSSLSVSKNRSNHTCYPICVSAKTSSALSKLCNSIKQHVRDNSDKLHVLRDVSYTLIVGKKDLSLRSATAIYTVDELISDRELFSQSVVSIEPSICIMFSGFGQGSKVDSTSFHLFCQEIPSFKKEVLICYEILSTCFPNYRAEFSNHAEGKSVPPHGSPFFQIYNVVFQVAVYNSLKALGVKASIVLGHSLGEYCAAFAAGVLHLKDMLLIVFKRALLVDEAQYDGKMLRVDLSGDIMQHSYNIKGSNMEIACYNSPGHCVVSGPSNEIEDLCNSLKNDNVKHEVLLQGKAFHHSNLKKIESSFKKCFEHVKVQKVLTKWLTTISGSCKINQIGSEVPLQYWGIHLTSAVDFNSACQCLNDISRGVSLIVVEIGVQSSLRAFLSCSGHNIFNCASLFTLKTTTGANIQKQLCTLWKFGVDIQLQKLPLFSDAKRVRLPTYPFESQRYWVSGALHNLSCNKLPTSMTPHLDPNHKDTRTESVLTFIRRITGDSFKDCFPEDSMFLLMLQDSVARKYNVDISQLLREKKKPIEIAQHVEACSGNHKQESIDAIKLLNPSVDMEGTREDKPLLFILHAVGGKLYSFQPLAISLSAVFLTCGVFLSDHVFKYDTIEECAKLYAHEIQKKQSHGPYYIGGFSFGAWMAHAVSNHLSAAGECVKLLALIDPVPMQVMEGSVLMQPTTFFHRVVSYGDLFVSHALQKGYTPGVLETFAQNFEHQYQLVLKYKQSYKPQTCPALILLAKDGIALQHDKALADILHWQSISQTVDIKEVPGTHSTCITSSNCYNIADAICKYKGVICEKKAVPVCSDHEIQGVWKLNSITLVDGNVMNNDFSKGHMKIGNDDYVCIVPHVPTNVSEKIGVFLNSCGKIDVIDQKINFNIEASVYYPDNCPCEVTGIATICGHILRIQIYDFILSFSY